LKTKFLENFSTFYHGICENLAVIRKLTIKKKNILKHKFLYLQEMEHVKEFIEKIIKE